MKIEFFNILINLSNIFINYRMSNLDTYDNLLPHYNKYNETHKNIRQLLVDTITGNNNPNIYGTINSNFKLDKDCSVLDVGCNNGSFLQIFKENGFNNVIGIDISQPMVDDAKRKGLNVICQDFNTYYKKSDIVCAQAFIHLFPKSEVKKIIRKLLSLTNKRLYMTTTKHEKSEEGLFSKMDTGETRYRVKYTRDEIIGIIHEIVTQDFNLSYFINELVDPEGKKWINFYITKENWKEIYDRDGYIHLRGFISKNQLKEIDQYSTEQANKPSEHDITLRFWDYTRNIFDRIENILPFAPKSVKEIYDSLQTVVEKITGESLGLFKDKLNFKWPQKNAFPAHQDALAGWDKYSSLHLTATVCLDNSVKINGALEVVRGRHKEGLMAGIGEIISKENEEKLNWELMETEAGDFIIFDSHTPHRSGPNISDQMRRMQFITYIRLQDWSEEKVRNFILSKKSKQQTMDEPKVEIKEDNYGKFIKVNIKDK
jgi:2-aminoethylphosphonate dioxygenase